ncbi:MAG: DUF2079 domain-containing protein [Bacteroidales bacterium]|nr:DUF2079 domain-containing protein [Bacteroidales bacterium]
MTTLTDKQKKITLATVFTVAGVLYALISLVNHYLFKTYALDLGLYTHAMYDYAHFRMADCSMFKPNDASLLSDHFDLYLPLLSPLVYLFGSYTLLLVQIVAVLLGGWGIYKLIGLYTDNCWMPICAVSTFFFSFGIIQAMAFDYHSNVLTAMMLPWLLFYLKEQRYAMASLFVVLFVIGKENMSLWLLFVALALMWDYRKDKKALWHLLAYAVFAIAYFFIINMILMPRLGGNGGGFTRYAYLGGNYAEIAKNLLLNPGKTLELLFTNTSNVSYLDGVKAEFYFCALASGMVLTLLKPNYLIMLIPLIAQKMLAMDGNFWGISLQYSVEFVPVLVVSSFLVIVKLKNARWRTALGLALVLSVVLTTFYSIGVPKSKIYVDQLCVYQGRHYRQKEFDVRYARELIEMIPDDASVSAATMFVPHLALRDHIQNFADAAKIDADYVLITERYLNFNRKGVLLFSNRSEYETVASDGSVFLFRRIRE